MLAFMPLIYSSIAYAAQCNANTDATAMIQSSNGPWAACEKATPDAIEVSFYKLALCTAKPTYTDDSSCSYILNSTSSIKATIAVGSTIPLLAADISIAEGVYTHAFMMIDTTMGLENTFEFATGNEQYDGAGNQGKYCWTNGQDIVWGYPNPATMPITCGSEPDPKMSYETFKGLGCDDNDPCSVTTTLTNQQTTTTTYDLYMLKNPTTLATVALDSVTGFPVGDAEYMWGVQKFNTPATINANTKQIELGFKLTEGMDMSFNSYSCTQPCVESVNITSFQFIVSTE